MNEQPTYISGLHQCLFGYGDGHQLLASSTLLPGDALIRLLTESDLAPGALFEHEDSYLTGFPVPSAKFYALMRTWSAPEMARPGCVWSHVILIGNSEMAKISNMSSLCMLFRRPVIGDDFSFYLSQPLLEQKGASRPVKIAGDSPTESFASYLLRAVYVTSGQSVVRTSVVDAQEVLFGLWSQQWPRLRRAFRFRSGLSAYSKPSAGGRFDLQLEYDSSVDGVVGDLVDSGADEGWEKFALEDLVSQTPLPFRRFLWRYGSDLRKGRERFHILGRVYAASVQFDSLPEELVLDVIFSLPDVKDGRTFKNDILFGWRNPLSLVRTVSSIQSLSIVIRNPSLPGVEYPGISEFLDHISDWQLLPDDLITIADESLRTPSELGGALLERLAFDVESRVLRSRLKCHLPLLTRLIRLNPAVIGSEIIAEIDLEDLLLLLHELPADDRITEALVRRLALTRSQAVARSLLVRSPVLSITTLVSSLAEVDWDLVESLTDVWREPIREYTGLILEKNAFQFWHSTRELAIAASLLGVYGRRLDFSEIKLWSNSIYSSIDDVRGAARDRFQCAMFVSALCCASPGTEPLFKFTFDDLHRRLAGVDMDQAAFGLLMDSLPMPQWWQIWDNCYRLRLALVHAFVDGNLDGRSFVSVTSDSHLRDQLVDIALSTPKGRRYIKRVLGR